MDPARQAGAHGLAGCGRGPRRQGPHGHRTASRHVVRQPLDYPARETPDGPTVAGLVIAASSIARHPHRRDRGGRQPLTSWSLPSNPCTASTWPRKSLARDKSGRLGFCKPAQSTVVANARSPGPIEQHGRLPASKQATAVRSVRPRWNLRGHYRGRKAATEIIKRIGRSPDWASAYCLALIDTPSWDHKVAESVRKRRTEHDPYA